MKNCKISTFFNQIKKKQCRIFSYKLFDLYLEDSDSVSNPLVVSTIIENLLLSLEQFYKLSSQLNEAQENQFNFIMQYALQCKLE